LEFARKSVKDPEFEAFARYLSVGFTAVEPAERFFLYLESPGSRTAARNLGRNFAQYARWGYIGQERPIVDPMTKRALGRYDPETRSRILKELVERYAEFEIEEYLGAVDYSVSRAQAVADLSACKAIERYGNGRSARWRRR
jgi:hypothetical protein